MDVMDLTLPTETHVDSRYMASNLLVQEILAKIKL